ncbi:MAG: hypothetical protein DRI46_13360 [Chloroflexi bacterium]|nr:MAG: hypothetical protein DRI46_13360 [Chloroflexota bacterium]
MGKLKAASVIGAILMAIMIALYLFWYLPYQYERSKNYKLGYESHVKGTVCEMVKPEHLKNPEMCN